MKNVIIPGASDVNDVRNFFLTFHWVGQDASPDHTKKAAIDHCYSSAVQYSPVQSSFT